MGALDLNDVSVFVQVVDSGSFTAAGRRLGAPTSTVSRRVARLESRLGVKLLHRTTRRLRLTDFGQRYYERGSRALEELEDAERELAELQATPRGRVRIAAPMEHAATMQLVSDFLAAYTEVSVELALSHRLVDLLEDGYDVSIRPGELPDATHLMAFKLLDSSFSLVASPDYLARRGEPTRVEELKEHDCIVFGSSLDANWSFAGTPAISVRGRFAANHLLSVRDAAVNGLGIALLPSVISEVDTRSGALKVVIPDARPPAVPIWVTYLAGRHISPAVRAFVDFAKEQFAPALKGRYDS